MREKMIELLADLGCNAEYCVDCEFCDDLNGCIRRQKEIIVDRLIAGGVTIDPRTTERKITMKSKVKAMAKIASVIIILALVLMVAVTFTGCQAQAAKVSYNLSLEADNFNDYRQLTVINCLQGDVLFQMCGKMSITADTADNQLEIVVEDENGDYKKHFVGLSDNVTYVVEDITSKDVERHKYTLNFNPQMWLPVDVEWVD